jgi:hypothetical protein
MRRWHFYVMGFVALGYGGLAMLEFILISFGNVWGWLELYPPAQIDWLLGLPAWVNGLFGIHAALALVGALCLLAHIRAAVWMLAFAFIFLVVLLIWAFGVSDPSLPELVTSAGMAWLTAGLVALLSFLIYLYARQEKRHGEVL